MGKLIDLDKTMENLAKANMSRTGNEFERFLLRQPSIEAIPKEEVRQFIGNIQKIKDNHNEYGEPINYGTICGILIEGYRLLDKYMEDKDGNNN